MAPPLSVRLAAALSLLLPYAAVAAPSFPGWMSNGLYRSMDEKERAFFGKPLAEVVRAMDKAAQAKRNGHCSAELSSGGQADFGRPAEWIRDQGKLTPKGLAPMNWEVPVVCSGIRATVTLSPITLTVVPDPGDKPTAAGPDVFQTTGRLVIGDFLVTNTKAAKSDGGTGAAADWADMPGLAKPVAIQVRTYQNVDLTDYIDVDAARQALFEVKDAPARSNPAVEADEQQGTEQRIADVEASVMSYLAGRNGKKTVVIADTTWRGGLPAEAETVLPAIAPDILGSAISDYRTKNRESRAVPNNLVVPGATVNLVTEETLRTFFSGGAMKAGWEKFAQTYGDTQLFTFSRVGVSHDLSQAVVFLGYQGPRIGTGSLLFLRSEANTWRVMYQLRLWVESATPMAVDMPPPPPPRVSKRKKKEEEPAPAPAPTAEPTLTPATTVASAKATETAPPLLTEPARPPPPPKVGLTNVKVRFVNDVDMFRFNKAEFFVNGESAGAPLKKVSEGSAAAMDIWEGTIPAGATVVRARLTYTGKAYFPFYYLDNYEFSRELIKPISLKRDEAVTLTVVASEDPSATKTMEDTLSIQLKQETTGKAPHKP